MPENTPGTLHMPNSEAAYIRGCILDIKYVLPGVVYHSIKRWCSS